MSCFVWRNIPPLPARVNPAIQFKPRHTLAALSHDEKVKEKDRLILRIRQKRIDFENSQAALSAHAVEVLKNVSEVLLEYPEIDITIEGHAGRADRRKHVDPTELSMQRAMACGSRLTEYGVIADIETSGRGVEEKLDHGIVKIVPSDARLLPPQQRLDRILSRRSFDFRVQSAELTEGGQRLAAAIARIMRETPHRCLITCPRKSSSLGVMRANAIAQAIQDSGCPNEVKAQMAIGNQVRATITIDDDAARGGAVGSQQQLTEILRAKPLAFQTQGQELVPDVLPVVKQCAEVLKHVGSMSCLVEAYSGHMHHKDLSDAKLREVMLERAQRVVEQLQAEGVTVPLYAKGYSTPYAGGGSLDISESRGPRLVLTLVSPGEEDDLESEQMEITEEEYPLCFGNGCM